MAKQLAQDILFVGFRPTIIDDLGRFLAPPTHPKTMSVQATIDNWKITQFPDLLLKQQFKAAFGKLTGRMIGIFAVDPRRKLMFDKRTSDEETVACRFIQWLRHNYDDIANITFVGFYIKEFLRVLGTEALTAHTYVPLEFWYQNEKSINPYEMLVEAERRDELSVYSVMQLVGIEYPADWELHADPMIDAVLAYQLATRYQLVRDDDKQFSADYGLTMPTLSEAKT